MLAQIRVRIAGIEGDQLIEGVERSGTIVQRDLRLCEVISCYEIVGIRLNRALEARQCVAVAADSHEHRATVTEGRPVAGIEIDRTLVAG